jgi:hypothetical protein
VKSLAVALIILAIAGGACMAATTRVAIVDVSTQPVPPAFVDLLTVALTQEPTVALLERDQVAQLLREQALGFALSGSDAVKAGKLAGVQAFLMLKAGTNQTLRVRLVDARYGLKLWDTMFTVGANAKDFEQGARALAKGTVFRLANFLCGTDTPRTVSISAFRSEEISKRWDWLGETLGTGIEQQLALQPGIVVMERARTRPLTEERELTEGRACSKVNLRTERVEVLAASIYWPFDDVTSRWRIASETPQRIVELLHGLVFIDAGNGTGRSALLCIDGRSAPVDLLNVCSPSEVAAKLMLRDMAPTDGGLLLLMDDALWLIPELRSEKQSP